MGIQVKKNAAALSAELEKLGHSIVTGGTDNHLLLWDLRPKQLTGSKIEKLLDYCNITVNKNAIFGDKSALSPGGVRLGTSALTTRRMAEAEMTQVAVFLDRACNIAIRIQDKVGKKLVDFEAACKDDEELATLSKEVMAFAKGFYIPGWDVETMKYKD